MGWHERTAGRSGTFPGHAGAILTNIVVNGGRFSPICYYSFKHMPDNNLLQRVKGLRSILALAVLAALAFIILITPAAAQPEMSIPFVTTPQFVFFNASHFPSLVVIETNTSRLATDNTAAFALSFAPVSGGLSFAPTIAQTSSRTIVAAQTYTFQDFLST